MYGILNISYLCIIACLHKLTALWSEGPDFQTGIIQAETGIFRATKSPVAVKDPDI